MNAAGPVLIALPVAYNVLFTALAKRFDYPDILRRPTGEILARFAAGGTPLVRTWEAFMLTALTFAAVPVLLAGQLTGADPTLLGVGIVAGVLAGITQTLGLLRWPFVVPHLARQHQLAATDAERAAQRAVFDALHRYLGVGVGEHLGYLLTGAWTALASAAVLGSDALPSALGWAGFVPAAALVLGSREFTGKHERLGWKPAEALVPVAYVEWSLWLVALGIGLLV